MADLPARRGRDPCRAAGAVDDPVGLLHEAGAAGCGAVSPAFPPCWRAITVGFPGVPRTATTPLSRAKRHGRRPALASTAERRGTAPPSRSPRVGKGVGNLVDGIALEPPPGVASSG